MTLDAMSNSPFVSQANIRQILGNLSLRAFFHAPFQWMVACRVKNNSALICSIEPTVNYFQLPAEVEENLKV